MHLQPWLHHCRATVRVACAVALTHKESILFMQRLAAIERNGITDGPIKAQYEEVFLNMLYTMCSTPRPDAPEVRCDTPC